jgi:hypothetical protein
MRHKSKTGGPDQIRTGVGAFAELCLATRPQDHYLISIFRFNALVLNLKAGKYTFFSRAFYQRDMS